MISLDYFEEIRFAQDEIFAGVTHFNNSVQSNLTVLTERHIASLKEERCSVASVSRSTFTATSASTLGKAQDRSGCCEHAKADRQRYPLRDRRAGANSHMRRRYIDSMTAWA